MKQRVLIVDDDSNLRRTLAEILRLKGYSPVTVSTGSEALESVLLERPAVALIDLRLEDMSGLDVLREIRKIDDAIACIVLTGYASQSSAIDAVNLGAYSYIQKPPNIDHLLLTMQRAIEKQASDLALRQSQALLYATGEMAKVGGWEIDVESEALVWTEEIYHIHGVTLDFAPTLEASLSFYPQEVRAEVAQAFARLLQAGTPFDLELPFVPARGERLWVHVMGKADPAVGYSAGGGPVKVSGTFQDVTERKRAEEALRFSNRRLQAALAELREAQAQVISQERLAAVGQMAAGLAHEYNNLMATIILYADMMLRSSPLNAVDRDRVAAIYDQGRRAADLTQQILDFSRKAILRKQKVAIEPLFHELEIRLHPVLSEKITLVIDLGDPRWRVNADPDRIRQALMNIALNARDAMPEGGILRIWAEFVSIDPRTVSPLPELKPGDWLVLHIQDTGTGIDPEVLPHIFEPFFTTRSPVGSGLGLSQVYGIVRQHDGIIDVKTQLGEGSTFSLYLPAMPLSELSGSTSEPGAAPRRAGMGDPSAEDGVGRPLTVVIEEHDLMRGALVAALDSLNYPSQAFATAVDAIRATEAGVRPGIKLPFLDRQQVRLILGCLSADTRAPKQSGWRELREWGAHPPPDGRGHKDSMQSVRALQTSFPQARIVLIGDQVPNREIQDLLRRGEICWLDKPVDLVKLGEILAEDGL